METTKKLNETPLLQEMNDTHSYVVVDDDGNVARTKGIPVEEYLDIVTPKANAKGELVHITDGLPLPTFKTTADGNVKQFTTKGNQLVDFSKFEHDNTMSFTFENDVLIVVGDGSRRYQSISMSITDIITNNPGKALYFTYENIKSANTADGIVVQLTISYNDGTTKYIALVKKDLTNIIGGWAIPSDTSVIRGVTLGVYTTNSASIIQANTITVTKPMLTFDENAPYEKFTNGASPNPEYPQEIEVLEGYNLIDIQTNNRIFTKVDSNAEVHQKYNNGILIDYEYKKDYEYHRNYRFVHIYYPMKADEYYCISATVTKLGTISAELKMYLPDTNQYPYIGKPFKPNQDTEWVSFYLDNANFVEGCKYAITDVILQEVESATATPKPYVSYGCVGVKVTGKNLSPVNNKTITGITSASSTIGNIQGTTIVKDIPINQGRYTLSYNKPSGINRLAIFLYNGSLNANSHNATYTEIVSGGKGINLTTISENTGTINIPSGYEHLAITTNNDSSYSASTNITIEISNLQIEEGSTATPYEPYKEQIVYLDLKGNWVGKIKDTDIEDILYTDKKNLWLDKVLKKRVFDGTESWRAYIGSIPEGLYSYVIDCLDCELGFQTSMCTHFTNVNYAWDKAYAKSGIYSDHREVYTKYFITNIPTLEEWKVYLKEEYDKGTPVTLVYKLAKPYTEDLGELPEPIKTFEGVNNIQILANLDTEIEVVYAQDVKKYIDSKLAEVSSQLL